MRLHVAHDSDKVVDFPWVSDAVGSSSTKSRRAPGERPADGDHLLQPDGQFAMIGVEIELDPNARRRRPGNLADLAPVHQRGPDLAS